MNKIDKKTGKLTPNFIFLAIASIGIGIFLLVQLEWYCIFFFLLGASILTVRNGIEVNPETKEYRKYNQLWWIKFGKWIVFKNIKYIALININQNQGMNVLSLRTEIAYRKCRLNLIYDNKKHENLFTDNKNIVLEFAKQLSEILDLKIYDATTKNKVWLD